MRSEWKYVKASDIVDFNPRESIPRNTMAKKVGMEHLQPFTRDIPAYELSPFKGGSKFRNGDTLMARITPCLENGKTAQVNILDDGEVGFGSTEFIVLRAKPSISDKDFIYYLAMSPVLREKAIKSMVGSSGRQRVQQGVLNNTEFYAPPLVEQQKIGRTLRTLDDKIANNTKINRHLEQMAQAIFKSWFVDFEPFGGEMPGDWREVPLGEVVEMSTRALNPQSCPDTILEHYSIPAFDETRLPVFEAASEIKSNKYIVDKDCFLISKLNPTTKRIWRPYCISPHAVCSTEFMVYRAKNRDHKDFYYSVIDSPAFTDFLLAHITGSTGSRQRAIPSETLSFSVIVPPDDIIEDFCDKVTAVYAHFEQNHLENRRLRQMRDALLPRLMSGELSVADLGDAK